MHLSFVWDLLTVVRSILDVVLQVNGYGFVVTPSPKPGVDHTPAMTWGVVDGTPFRLDAGDTPQMAVGDFFVFLFLFFLTCVGKEYFINTYPPSDTAD
jgi:hypothetical protein